MLWLEKPGTNDWQEAALFIPVGIIMFIIWLAGFIAILLSFMKTLKNRS